MVQEDPIEKAIGKFGKYQTWILLLLILGRCPTDHQLNNVVFIIPSVNYVCLDEYASNETNYCPCENPEYDQTMIVNSVTSEWNLICERKHLASLAQSMLQIGILLGSLLYGFISDKYGRKTAVILAIFSNAVFITCSALIPEYWMFLVFRFLIGTATGGTMLCTFVLIVELSGKSFRPYLLGLYEMGYITSYIALPIIAYFVRDWRHLQMVTAIPWLLVISYCWLLPESPRWLIMAGRRKDAVNLLTHIAKKNRRSVDNIELLVDEFENNSREDTHKQVSYLDLFKTPKMRIYTIASAFVWLSCTHSFYGINQYIGRLQGNIYLNVLLSAISLTPVIIIVVISILYLKRKVTVCSSFILTGLSLFVMIFIPSEMIWHTLGFAMIGQIGAFGAFIQLYLYTSEIFPTVTRNSAMGFVSMFARIGGFIAPFVVNIEVEWGAVLTFSLVAFAGGFLCCLLPETKDIVLPNTIEEIEGVTKKKQPPAEIE